MTTPNPAWPLRDWVAAQILDYETDCITDFFTPEARHEALLDLVDRIIGKVTTPK